MGVQAINSYSEFKEKINGDKVIVIDFWAAWCGPCKEISPIYEQFSNSAEYAAVEFYKVNVDSQKEIMQEVAVKAMPIFIAFKQGNKMKEQISANPAGLQFFLTSIASL